MSVASYSGHQDLSLYKKAVIRRRNSSGELDVFEAANYFSASNISQGHKPSKEKNISTHSCKDYQAWRPAEARLSLDVVLGRTSKLRVSETTQTSHLVNGVKEKMIKHKQPSSPGGRLASFLTSLFNHTAAKKKKKKAGQDDPRPRMRRSSISHVDSRSMHSSSSTTVTGIRTRTPPPVLKTFFDDSKSLQDHKRVAPSLPKQTWIENGVTSSIGSDQNPKISNGSLSAVNKIQKNSANGLGENEMVSADKKIGFQFKKAVQDDDDEGDQSDTSSDLFELQNYDLGELPSGLPVYETTKVDRIKNSPKLARPNTL